MRLVIACKQEVGSLRIYTLLMVLFLTACASGPVRPPQETAIFHALVQDAVIRKVVDQCGELSIELKSNAWMARKEWWQRNGPFVEAADYGFSYNILTLTDKRQQTGARYAMAMAYDVAYESEAIVNSAFASGNKQDVCEALLSDYSEGKKDLSKNKNLYGLLLSLVQASENQHEDLLLKQAEVSIKNGRKFSRSSITAERLANRQVCPRSSVSTLKADWPVEVFEVSCPDKSFAIIACNWGNCKVTK